MASCDVKKKQGRQFGHVVTKETREKLSLALRGKNTGRIVTEETRQKIRLKKLGRKLTPEHRRKLVENHVGTTGMKFTEEHKLKIGESHKGLRHSAETRAKIGLIQIGRKASEETRRRMSESAKRYNTPEVRQRKSEQSRGEKGNGWKGGVTPINQVIRHSLEYRLWRESVFTRDNWTCIWCQQRGGRLNADHIKPFALFPELRFAIDNGRTLCEDCHKKTDTYGPKTHL